MVVGRDLGPPAVPERHPPPALLERRREPVPVEVEEVVVRPPLRPRLVVLAVLRVGHGHGAAPAVGPVDEAVAPVRVEERVEEDDDLAEHGLGLALGGGEVVEVDERGLGPRRLVPVDGVPLEQDGRHPGDLGVGDRLRRLTQPDVLGPDLAQPGVVLRRRHDGVDEPAPLVRRPVEPDGHARRRRRHGLDVADDFLGPRVPLADREAQHLLGRRDGRVVGRRPRHGVLDGERDAGLRRQRGGEGDEGEGDQRAHVEGVWGGAKPTAAPCAARAGLAGPAASRGATGSGRARSRHLTDLERSPRHPDRAASAQPAEGASPESKGLCRAQRSRPGQERPSPQRSLGCARDDTIGEDALALATGSASLAGEEKSPRDGGRRGGENDGTSRIKTAGQNGRSSSGSNE